ncbi:MAG: hypothetical protein CDV28_12529 [Candidatus Electronema aureum]|uniref:Caldesmon n=1 Tax=Candidatus Electronema aureum TaxID=2005002 RepID=A0A521G0F0_9BACT|nr:MAG: hypothetical protein CDV28_12529 [Candidatus Electronema aureum]
MNLDINQKTSITCPECGKQIDVNGLLYSQIEKELQDSSNKKLAEQQKTIEEQANILARERNDLEKQKKSIQDEIQLAVANQLQIEKQKQESQIRQSVTAEMTEQYKAMQEELERKSEQVKELNRVKAEIARVEREKAELKESIEAEAQRKITEVLREERGKIQRSIEEREQFKLMEKDHLISQLKIQLQETQRKAEQGSTQLQGEVQELAIEAWLRDSFPFDEIEEIKKGVRGADCLHIVNTRTRQNCGSIYYESKRTKEFQSGWIEKFKGDLQVKNADVGVIVTEAMPRDMERMGLKEGIWICSFEEFKGLCVVLRESIVRISNSNAVHENKGDKMNMIYTYLTSNEFKLQIEAIVEGFSQMQADLNAEKRYVESSWKKREKQIDKVILNTNHMYSSIKGIAGSAIPAIPYFEFNEITMPVDN